MDQIASKANDSSIEVGGRLSRSDHKIRFWNCDTWETIGIIPEPTNGSYWIPTLAFHPTLPLLACAASEPDTPDNERSRLIHLWELDYDVLLRKRAGAELRPRERTASYALAKVLLII